MAKNRSTTEHPPRSRLPFDVYGMEADGETIIETAPSRSMAMARANEIAKERAEPDGE